MARKRNIFVVDDEPAMLRYMQTLLELEGITVDTAPEPLEAIARLKSGYSPDLIFLDLLMPNLDGLEALEQIMQWNPRTRVIIVSCISDTAKVVQAMRLGALDYLTKPFQKSSLDAVLSRYCSPGDESDAPACEVIELEDGDFFLTASERMNRIRAEVELIAQVDIPVLILGESGTGKEVIARLLRERSQRASKPFIKVNCAALPADLLESEFFGYEAGAFTGANKAKAGKFELCEGGILFLDEIGELPVQLQAKLLHVLQDGEFSRLGSRSSKRVDVRVIAATNINVQNNIANKMFREDLYYRLAAFTVTVPPLRERKQEILPLLKHMMAKLSESYGRPPMELSPQLSEACLKYDWPGNVRELSNFVKRLLVLRDESFVLSDLRTPQRDSMARLSDHPSRSSAQRRTGADARSHGVKPFSGERHFAAASVTKREQLSPKKRVTIPKTNS